eukprot:CAMPEP_0115418530 /NCGR_PEP_ID=MMETSP0271-20121206/24714_1 /TAXON_ID=71861 /ORGANISM="Scrippsiella trochoidea, Strain CCMP3099" /LENGTH=114 /DNA_ID=CAMNT_0002843005 /DNA_START=102 /DNA_END=443 /DNA_ORIENTATION=+
MARRAFHASHHFNRRVAAAALLSNAKYFAKEAPRGLFTPARKLAPETNLAPTANEQKAKEAHAPIAPECDGLGHENNECKRPAAADAASLHLLLARLESRGADEAVADLRLDVL